MRRSKSNPAKYARNYRKISQRRMTTPDEIIDEETEIERLRSVLQHSERRLKQIEEPEDYLSSPGGKRKRKDEGKHEDPEAAEQTLNATAIFSEDFASELTGCNIIDKENPLVVLPNNKKKSRKAETKARVHLTPEEIREAKATHKKTAKRLHQLEARASQKKKRVELYKRLEESQTIPQSQLQPLLNSSGKLSRKNSLTKKQTLKRILERERAGLPLTQSERELLYPQQEVGEGTKSVILQKSKSVEGLDQNSLIADLGPQIDTKLPLETAVETLEQISSSQEPIQKTVGTDFASLMVASLSKLSKDSNKTPESALESTTVDHLVGVESKRRYSPSNPTCVKTPAAMGLQPSFIVKDNKNQQFLEIKRPECVEKSRYDLPVTAMEFEITDAIRNNDVTIICSETGSGKSTQVPAFLYEAGMTLPRRGSDKSFQIGITQPRRVAAMSTAKRVCFEMGQGNGQLIRGQKGKGNLVAYQTRYESAGVGSNTCIKFMTDGILLNEIQNDLLLRRYSVIILDESHERNLNTDVLIGLLSVALPLRKKAAEEDSSMVPLKLVLMSATLRVEDFTKNEKLFPTGPPTVVNVPGRTYPVTIHHSKLTELDDYETAAFKVCKIHRRLPHGGILVFVTGKSEVIRMVKRLRSTLGTKNIMDCPSQEVCHDVKKDPNNFTIDVVPREMDDDEFDADDAAIDDIDIDETEKQSDEMNIPEAQDDNVPRDVVVLPMYSLLSGEDQARVFGPVPDNHRLIVVATNIAETSITIPGISYVVDTGRQKCRNYSSGTGVSSYDVMWISKASADQRSGRAGRTGPGHCYRLYSSALYSRHMDLFALPEVLTRPLEDVVLAMKSMKISDVSAFPFPTPPDRSQIDASVKILADIGCLDITNVERDGGDGIITKLGETVSKLPLGVRYSKMLLVAAQAGVLDYAIIAVAALSEPTPFGNTCISESTKPQKDLSATENDDMDDVDLFLMEEREASTKKMNRWYHVYGDVLATIMATGAYTYAGRSAGGFSETLAKRRFCEENGLSYVVMERIQKMRFHLASLSKKRLASAKGVAATTGKFTHNMPPPTKVQELLLVQAITSGLLDHVALLATPGSISGDIPIDSRSAYIGCRTSTKSPIFLDKGCSIYSRDYRQLPRWVCYDSVVRKTTKDGTAIVVMKNITPVDPQWLGKISQGSRILSLGCAISTPPPFYDDNQDAVLCSVVTRYGSHSWNIPPLRIIMYDAIHNTTVKSNDFASDDPFRWFARFLWEGKVIPEMSTLRHLMNDDPVLITKKTPSSKVNMLVASLENAGIHSRHALLKHWAENEDKFLFRLLKSWIQPQHYATAKKVWIEAVRSSINRWKEEKK